MRIKLSLLGLLTAATALAQTTYKPKLIQGLVKGYNQDITLKVSNPNQNYSATIHVEDRYEVTSVSKDSVIINYMVTKIDTQGSKAAEESANASFGLMLNKPLKASYNPDGSFRHLLNADELISGTSGNAKILAEQIFTDNETGIHCFTRRQTSGRENSIQYERGGNSEISESHVGKSRRGSSGPIRRDLQYAQSLGNGRHQ